MSKQNELFGFTDASEATGKPVRRRRRNSLAGKPQLTPSSAVLTRLVETSHEIATSPDPLPALGACGCKSTMSISVPAPGADPVRGFGSCPLPGSHRAGTRGRATVTTALARRGKAKGRDSISVACFSFGPHAEMAQTARTCIYGHLEERNPQRLSTSSLRRRLRLTLDDRVSPPHHPADNPVVSV